MLKTFLIACTLMMASSVYADGNRPAVGEASNKCHDSNASGKTNCGTGDNVPN